jgi:hypothetical protein
VPRSQIPPAREKAKARHGNAETQMTTPRYGDQTPRLSLAADDSVVGSHDRWNTFIEHHWVGSLRQVVPGASFWSFVEGSRPAVMYDLLLAYARSRQTAVSIDVWAAGPQDVKKVELSIAPSGANGGIELVLRSLARRRGQPFAIFDKGAERTADEVGVCSFCLSVFAFGWQETERGLGQLRFASDGPQPRIVPRVCDQCERTITGLSVVFPPTPSA